MTISENKIYPRTGDKETVYLKSVVTDPSITIGDFTMYNDFVNDPREFEKNNVLYHYFFEEWGLDVKDITSAWDNKGDIVIGNDVWIGYEAVIMSGVTIGDGAIIGTRALVTNDVPPYTIVGGVPAKQIRKRFPEEIISELLKLKWWDWTFKKISQNMEFIKNGDLKHLK